MMQYAKYLQNYQNSLNKNGKGFCDVCIHLPTQETGYTPASPKGMGKSTEQKNTKELTRISLEPGEAEVVSTI